ncbi:hypothetical protein CCR94_00300 [Rhodoblastus sphagnicola]|uniref:Oxidoreductase n=1 Tax=Rhodoblastus sphagnicola TaxID=333368 RepID=A0A2S6NH69_9HYPH|nr:DUF934 domain-containing protein [Rhodoblastus sphagnicola]MBB4200869.1 uncharacterized protein (DUF934 family) [Rhodoblastus sphagnicola]PPQ33982.1 hypothetical protein CCR94_00300 [Rhodoblastus sphagnicola]
MRALDRQAFVTDDLWRLHEDGAPPQANDVFRAPSLADALEKISAGPVGAWLPPDQSVDALAPFLQRLSLICIEFPKFRDGRGFTAARRLRQSHGFTGDIRAVGRVLPDQFQALIACGFSSVAPPENHPPDAWRPAAAAEAARPFLLRMIGRAMTTKDAAR